MKCNEMVVMETNGVPDIKGHLVIVKLNASIQHLYLCRGDKY